MLKSLFLLLCLALPVAAQQAQPPAAQQAQPPAAGQPGQPQVRVNVLNVCTPSPEEQKAIAAALAAVPREPAFDVDFEVDRGRTQVPDGPVASWVRLRRDFKPSAALATAQYSFSVDDKGITETLVFRARDTKDFLQVALDDTVTGGAGPAEVLATDTPVSHLKIERFGKSSLALARCEADQSAYEPLFRTASQLMSRYRTLLGVRRSVPADLRMLGLMKPSAAAKPAARKPPKPKP